VALALLSCNNNNVSNGIPIVHALKHNYYTRRDERTFIGPLGYPFGFLDTGHFNLTVFDFELKSPKEPHTHDPHFRLLAKDKKGKDNNDKSTNDDDGPTEMLKAIKGVGFLLKRFPDEAAFSHYMAYIQADHKRCIFQPFLDAKADNDDTIQKFMKFEDDDYMYMEDDDYVDDGLYMGDDNWYEEDLSDDDQGRRLQLTERQQQIDPKGYGEVLQNISDGIFLDMLSTSRWRPRIPYMVYDFQPGEAGLYFLMYQVCYKDEVNKNQNQNLDIHSRFELDFHFSNLDMFGNESYLSAGEMFLPHLFFYFSLIYAICLYMWCKNIMNIKEGKPGLLDTGSPVQPVGPVGRGAQSPSATVYPIHYMMGFLLTLKTCALFFESIRYHYLRVTGHAVFWAAVYYTFAFMKGITLFTVILLIGSGWSFVKPFLSQREKKMIMCILVLQVINNIAIVVLTQETEGEHSFDRWTAVLHLVDILCCCAVLIPIVWQVNQLEKNMDQDQHNEDEDDETKELFDDDDEFDDEYIPEDEFENGSGNGNGSVFSATRTSAKNKPKKGPTDARLAAKLKLFRSFYILVVAYIYITRIVVYLFATTLNYKHTWIRYFVVELVTLLFYITVGMLFRPMNENPYLHVRRRGDKATGVGGKGGAQEVELRKIDPSSKAVID
jgi:hypothetical protein